MFAQALAELLRSPLSPLCCVFACHIVSEHFVPLHKSYLATYRRDFYSKSKLALVCTSIGVSCLVETDHYTTQPVSFSCYLPGCCLFLVLNMLSFRLVILVNNCLLLYLNSICAPRYCFIVRLPINCSMRLPHILALLHLKAVCIGSTAL